MKTRLMGMMMVTLLAGCSSSGLLGVELGKTVAEAKKSFEPLLGEGSWTTEGDLEVYTAEGGAPHRVVLYTDSGKVTGVHMIFEDEQLKAAEKVPVTFRLRQEEKQAIDEQPEPYDVFIYKSWVTPTAVHMSASDGTRFELGRWDRAYLKADGADCEAANKTGEVMDTRRREVFGDDGTRDKAVRDRTKMELILMAGAMETMCPEGSGPLTAEAELYRTFTLYNGAMERYKNALKNDADWGPQNAATAHAGLGAVYFRFKKKDQAAEHYKVALAGAAGDAQMANIARSYADASHDALEFDSAKKYYTIYLEKAKGGDTDDTLRVFSRLIRASIETEGGCDHAAKAAILSAGVEGGSERARAGLLAADAFRIIACEPKKKKDGMEKLGEAVKLDPLMAAEWADLVAYYDREAQDKLVLDIMLENEWLDKRGVEAAKAWQAEMRDEKR